MKTKIEIKDTGCCSFPTKEPSFRLRVEPHLEEKKPYSIVKWQTGEPKERGEYLVTLLSGKVKVAEFYKYKVADKEYWGCIPYGIVGVKAWCKLSDIEPYKEEEV